MYLMDRTQLLAMPPDTVFSRFYPELLDHSGQAQSMQPIAFGALHIKGMARNGENGPTCDSNITSDDGGMLDEALLSAIATINHYRDKLEQDARDPAFCQSGDVASAEELYAIWEDQDLRELQRQLQYAGATLPSSLLASVDARVAPWVYVEDAAATS